MSSIRSFPFKLSKKLDASRFIPSEFGADPDKARIPDLDYGFYAKKSEIRRVIGKEGIPYTYISCNFFTRYLLPSLAQPGLNTPPRDRVKIFGDGNTKELPEEMTRERKKKRHMRKMPPAAADTPKG
ncbi:probable pinoresinol-lariciresinol reductase 3 [Magnolia sinica]|uniref:probable pinoresinol-lariciresinol reductase 3 n=1 Tax=Magnolia sinica TaxID=86752 RepID=UPI00265B6E7C|nr:probable pinoresinol-lariciresinol reductase 3 [Magnolia sinica]